MLTLKLLRENPQFVVERLAVKNFDASGIVDRILEQDRVRRSCQTELDASLAAQKAKAKEIGALMQQGRKDEAEAAKKEVAGMKDLSKKIEARMEESERLQNELLVQLPNIPDDIVPAGKNADDNVIVRMGGDIPVLSEDALPHWELASKYDIIDFDLGVKLTGAGFPVYKGKGARLQRSLIQYFLDFNTKAGYMEIEPPVMVNEASAFATGQLPDKEGQMYFASQDKFYLVPTAEVPVTNIYRDTILSESDFPVKMTAYTPCFRREAGSYGKDVRGLNRLHQFDKVEIVQLSLPEASERALNEMVLHVERLVNSLDLPYRIVRLCGGDMSFTSAITYDFEVYSAAQKRWLEVSSVSNFKSYQANRLKLRYKDSEGRMNLAHTLNGSSLALPRIVAAILENNQTPDGINIPKVLQEYTRFIRID
ncbi:MAG TPA: serine--tRNA ligase [Candidatus Coprenecus stercoravium]|uniref:Serine--tRNA ligase n=1 Tax=Candidatus Coprenecus stercoravium TaxID=2840735 RepID=A0A9D2GPM7_9BACT|nr:serine--tRNA ligase [Candidatus Coprenecus stercoravium]